jgi:hypothetical protein
VGTTGDLGPRRVVKRSVRPELAHVENRLFGGAPPVDVDDLRYPARGYATSGRTDPSVDANATSLGTLEFAPVYRTNMRQDRREPLSLNFVLLAQSQVE